MWHITEDSQWTTLRDTGTKPRHDKKSAQQNSGIGMNYLASFSLTCRFHFFVFYFEAKNGKKILNEQLMLISLSSKSINSIYRIYENTGYM